MVFCINIIHMKAAKTKRVNIWNHLLMLKKTSAINNHEMIPSTKNLTPMAEASRTDKQHWFSQSMQDPSSSLSLRCDQVPQAIHFFSSHKLLQKDHSAMIKIIIQFNCSDYLKSAKNILVNFQEYITESRAICSLLHTQVIKIALISINHFK